jgi:uncharacterized phiE125 gp8 family phage protein
MELGHTTFNVSVEPTNEPLRLEDLKCRIRVTTSDFNAELRELMTAARRQVEHDTRRKLVTQTVQILMDDFPSTEYLEMRMPPISAVTSIGYTDSAGAAQTFSSASYNTDFTSTPPRVKVIDGVFWPATDDIPNAVTITVTAGYGAPAAVPPEAKLAIVEYCKMHWGNCDGDSIKYRNLVQTLQWTAIGRAA